MDLIKTTVSFVLALTITLIAAAYFLAGDAIRQAAPFVVWTFAGALVTSTLGALAIAAVVAWLFIRNYRAGKDSDYTAAKNEAKTSDLEFERNRLHFDFERVALGAQAGQMRQGIVFVNSLGEAGFASHAAAVAKLIQKNDSAYLESPTLALLDHIGDLPNVLVVGGKGSGKTCLLQHLEAGRLASGKTIVLDSHAQPGQWQGEVIGCGREYEMIKLAMVGIVSKLDNRYKSYATGRSQFESITSFVDEFTMLPRKMKDIGYDIQSYSIPVLTEGRKVNVNAVWGIHSDRAAALGLEGAKDLIECFDAVVYLKNSEFGRYALVNFGEGINKDQRYSLPAPLVISAPPATTAQPTHALLADNLPVWDIEPAPNLAEKAALEAHNQGKSLSACYRTYHKLTRDSEPPQRPSAAQIQIVKEIYAKWSAK